MENSNISPVSEDRAYNLDTPTNQTPEVPHQSPVTEAEMTEFQTHASEFFGRIVSTVVGMSEQAKELDKLRLEVQAATAKLNGLIEDNARKADEIEGLKQSNAWLSRTASENGELARRYGEEAAKAKEDLGKANSEHSNAIAALRYELEREKIAHDDAYQRMIDQRQSLEARLSDVELTLRDRETALAEVTRDCDRARDDSNQWAQSYERADNEVRALKQKLEAIQSVFKQVQSAAA